MKAEDQQLAAHPFWYLQQLQHRHNSAAARVEVRKRRRLGAAVHQGEGDEMDQAGPALLVTGRAARRDDRHRYACMPGSLFGCRAMYNRLVGCGFALCVLLCVAVTCLPGFICSPSMFLFAIAYSQLLLSIPCPTLLFRSVFLQGMRLPR
jgi:hypothetical protein